MPRPDVYDAFFDFLLERIEPDEILAFTASEEEQERADLLLEKNNSVELTPEEAEELETMRRLDAFISVLKAKALSKARSK
jgi:methyltransferase-like protein